MIPSIESIVKGLLDGSYTTEQAAGWLREYAKPPDEDRMIIAGMAMQGMLAAGTGDNRFDRARDAVAHADALLDELARVAR